MQSIDGKKFPIAFYSRTMSQAKKKYVTSHKELLAIEKAVEHFQQFLYRNEFIIKTDHLTLTSIQTNSKLSARIGKWLGDLSEYNCKIDNKKGKANVFADALSRELPPRRDIHRQVSSLAQTVKSLAIIKSQIQF